MTAPHTMRAGAGLRLLRAAVFAAVCVVLSAAGHAVASCATVPWWAVCLAFLAVLTVAAPLAGRRCSLPGIAAALAGGQLALHTLFGLGQHTAAAASGPVAGTGTAAASADTSLAALAARLVCGGNPVALSPAEARRILAAAGIDPAALAAQAGDAAQAAGATGAAAHTGAHAQVAQALAEPGSGLFSLPMLLGHLLAALAAGWLLGRGDAALFRLLQLSRRTAGAAPVRALRAALAFVRALAAGLRGALSPIPRPGYATAGRACRAGREALHHTVIRRGPPATAFSLAA
ncbi:hypothetical protein [Streptomyces sp. NPDC090022]|uniref:hypothetical protein n=1 Tax=Streptomyces sp. NPDC090022 TaxID=3365920 RepID=UPI003824191F